MKAANHKTGITVKVVFTFAIVSFVTGLLFALVASRPALEGVWFRYEEYLVLPTTKLLLLATSMFCLSQAVAYLIAHTRKWLTFSSTRLIVGVVVIATLPVVARLVESMPIPLEFFLFRSLLALILAGALVVITQRWYWGIASLMLAVAVATPLLASVQYAVVGAVSAEWFEISEFLAGSLLLSVLFGYWLAKSATAAPSVLTASAD
jgi:hypothetical protein